MRKAALPVLLALLLAPALLSAQTVPKFGVGASVGLNMPLVQDDQGSGYIMQFRGRWSLGNFLVVEPNIAFGKYGEPGDIDVEDHGSFSPGIDGSNIVSYGVQGVLGGTPGAVGFKPFFVGGIGFYKMSRDDTEGLENQGSNFGWNAGLGFGLGVSPKLDVDARGQFHLMTYEGGSKKSASVMVGINYAFGSQY